MNTTPATKPHHRLVIALVVLASVLAFFAVFAVWAKRQVLETESWKETSSKLLENPEIRTAVADRMVDTLYANVDIEENLQQNLPPELQGLAGPAAGALHELLDNIANEALQRPRVQQLWETANVAAQSTLIQVIKSDQAEEGVTLDLGTIIEDVGTQAGINVADKVPPDAAQIEVIPPNRFESARKAIDLLEGIALALTVITLLLYALAIYLAKGWRREALRATGIGFIVVGIAVLLARNAAGGAVTDSLATTAAAEPAINATWSIGTSLLRDGGAAMLFYGIFIVLGAWLAGPTGIGREVRRAITPILQRRGIAYAAAAIVLLILFWWAPTEGFHRLPISLLLIALFVAGVEALRHQAVAEFPDQTWEAGTSRWQASGRNLLDRRHRDKGDQ